MDIWIWILVPIVGLVLLIALFVRLHRRTLPLPVAQKRFLQQREHLEAEFFTAAARSGKPRGLRWVQCEWESEVVFARERASGGLTALVAVTIRFEAVEGSDMEGLPAVSNLRHASAVFFLDGERWRTTGRAVFNLNPGEAIEHFKGQYERVEA